MTRTPAGGIPERIWEAITTEADVRTGEQFVGEVLLAELAALRDALPAAIAQVGTEARASGASWVQIAEALGYGSPTQARQVVDREAAERKRAADRERQEALRSAQPQREGDPGISVSEAARRFGVSRPTVYAWIRDGRIGATPGRTGAQRVVTDPDGRPLP